MQVTAPAAGRVTIAGRRLATGEVVGTDVIDLADFPPSPAAAAAEPGSTAAGSGGVAAAGGSSEVEGSVSTESESIELGK